MGKMMMKRASIEVKSNSSNKLKKYQVLNRRQKLQRYQRRRLE